MTSLKALLFCLGLSMSLLLTGFAGASANEQATTPVDDLPEGQKILAWSPDSKLTREELAAIVAPFANTTSAVNEVTTSLNDVPSDRWSAAYIAEAREKGLMNAYREGRFFPDLPVTRAEGFSVLVQAVGVPQISPSEVDQIMGQYADSGETPVWARHNVAIAILNGYIPPEDSLRPNALITQEEVAYAIAQQMQQHGDQIPSEIADLQEFLKLARENPEAVFALQPELEETSGKGFEIPWKFLVLLALIGGAGTMGWRWWQRAQAQDPRQAPPIDVPPITDLDLMVKSLKVQDKSNNGRVQEIDTGRGIELTFGDQSCIYSIKNFSGGILFTLMATVDGFLTLNGKKPGVLCNGQPIPSQGAILSGDVAFEIAYKANRLRIEPSFETAAKKKKNGVQQLLNPPSLENA